MLLCLMAARWGSAPTSAPCCRDGAVSEQLRAFFTPKSNRNGVVGGAPGLAIPCIAPPCTSSQRGDVGRAGSWKEVGKTDLHHKPSYAKGISKENSHILQDLQARPCLQARGSNPLQTSSFKPPGESGRGKHHIYRYRQQQELNPMLPEPREGAWGASASQRMEAICPWGQRMDRQP